MKKQTFIATYRSYQGHDRREKLLGRVVNSKWYERISEAVCHPTEINHIRIQVWFRGTSRQACYNSAAMATMLSGFTLESFA